MLDSILPWHAIPYQEQLEKKQALVIQALKARNLLPPSTQVAPTIASPKTQGYRARIKVRSGTLDGKRVLGFFSPGSHSFIAPDLAQLALPPIVELAHQIENLGYLKDGGELRTDGKTAVLVLDHPVPKPLQTLPNVAVNNRHAIGKCELRIPHPVGTIRASPLSFFQINLEINQLLVQHVDHHLQQLAPATLLDIYGGIGNLSVAAARRGTPTLLIEREGPSASDARQNMPGITVIEKDAAKFREGETFFDVVVLDPPRAGAPGLLPKLAITLPRAIVYVSCDPVSLAHDISELPKGKYRIAEVTPFDMFPGTEHVETVAVLVRD